jgi:LmbE family N-acetylglucosaminyl deacetylase
MLSDPQTHAPKRAMVIVAHPDDAEFMASGTVAGWVERGAEVTYVVVTKGDKGSEDPQMTPSRLTAIREAEQRAACAVLGVANAVFLGYPDGYLQHTLDLRRDLTAVVRRHRPNTVITFDPTTRYFGNSYLNHPDHRTTGDATLDAIFPSARDRLTFPELLTENLEPHKVREVWLGLSSSPDTVIDISAHFDKKLAALRAHPSQFGKEVFGFIEQMAREIAADQPFEFGETFKRIVLDQERSET